MAESKAEVRIRQLEREVDSIRTEATYLLKPIDEARISSRETERTTAELRQQHALHIQKLDEQQKRLEKWDARLWGVLALTIGAALSLAAALIVALVKR